MARFLIIVLVVAIYLALLSPRPPEAEASPPSPPDQWEWLQDTDWYVPQQFLPAVELDLETLMVTPVSDQTVFHIDEYSNGYFWGSTVVQIFEDPPDPLDPVCLQLVGSVTSDGSLQLTFTPILPKVPPEFLPTTTGRGKMRRVPVQTNRERGWQMELQMSAGIDLTKVLTHWAFMTQCPPGVECILPGLEIPLDEFLASCP